MLQRTIQIGETIPASEFSTFKIPEVGSTISADEFTALEPKRAVSASEFATTLAAAKAASPGKFPLKGVDTQRSGWDVAADQTRNVVQGGKDFVTGLPAMAGASAS